MSLIVVCFVQICNIQTQVVQTLKKWKPKMVLWYNFLLFLQVRRAFSYLFFFT